MNPERYRKRIKEIHLKIKENEEDLEVYLNEIKEMKKTLISIIAEDTDTIIASDVCLIISELKTFYN